MHAYIFEGIFNIVLLLAVHIFLNLIFTRRYSLPLTVLLQLLQTAAVIAVCWNIPGEFFAVKTLIIPATTLVLILLIFRERWWSSLLLMVCYVILENIMIMLFYPTEVVNAPPGAFTAPEVIMAWLPMMATTVFVLWLVFLGLRLCQNQLGLREVLTYALFPISQFLLFYGWNNMVRLSEISSGRLCSALALCFSLAADIVLFAIMFRLNRQKALEAENWLLARQIEAQKEHYSELTAQYENIRRMRHDIQKHIAAMDSLLSAGRSEEAAAYASELRAADGDASLGVCEHPVADAFLHNAISSARGTGVPITVAAAIPADITVADTDLVCTLGNLLDNAVEACIGQEGAWVRVESYVAGNCLVIRTENPVCPRKREKAAHIPGLDRGVGTRVLEDLAEKYSGRFSRSQEGGIFRAEIIYSLGER